MAEAGHADAAVVAESAAAIVGRPGNVLLAFGVD